MRLPEGQRSTEWVARLTAVVSALNNEVTRLTGKKPVKAIKEKTVSAKPSTPYLRSVGVNEKKLPSGVSVRYLYQPGELEGGRRRATDPICLWRCSILKDLSQNLTNRFCITYATVRNVVLFARNCLLFPLIPNSHLAKDNQLDVIFYRLCANTIWQYPPLVIIRPQTEFVLLICAHGSFYHTETSVCGFIFPSV